MFIKCTGNKENNIYIDCLIQKKFLLIFNILNLKLTGNSKRNCNNTFLKGKIVCIKGDSKFKSSNKKGTSLIRYMYELKGKRTSNIHLSENNTIIISHLKIFREINLRNL